MEQGRALSQVALKLNVFGIIESLLSVLTFLCEHQEGKIPLRIVSDTKYRSFCTPKSINTLSTCLFACVFIMKLT